MPPIKFSDQQRDLVKADGHTFAEACPGAGKTRAIVARFLRRAAEEPRKGVALLSFTNAAVDEVRSRCRERADALLAPHFVGTFDSFINRFITRPQYVHQFGLTPRFTESWQGIRDASFRLSDMGRLPSFSLDWFEFDWMLRAALNEQSIRPRQHRRVLAQVIADRGVELEEQATKRCRGLVGSGRLSCAASRALAVGYLRRQETAELFGALLAARFSEVIVDEAQDCGPDELRVLQLLKDWGVTVVMVTDLDQSIFEFRRADPDGVRAFADGLGTPLTLNGNYRSSPAICTLNNSLRHSSREETPAGDNTSCTTPVQLLSFRSPRQVAAAVEAVLAAHDVPRNDVIFLAHRTTDARSCAGSPADSTTHSTNAVLGIAWASRRLRTGSSDGRTRRQAVELGERTLRIVADDDQTDPALDERWLRDAVVRLAVSLDPTAGDAKAYALGLRQYIAGIHWPAGTTPRTDLGMMFKAPAQKDWLAASRDDAETFAYATIHSVKGREFPAVVVVLPKNLLTDADNHHVLDHWERGIPSELRRVLYVGASRAQKLLILAAHTDHINRVTSRLKKDDVPHVLVP